MQHLIAYEGLVTMSLAVMQEEYIDTFAPWPNRRSSVIGTMQRAPYTISSGKEWVRGLDKQKGKNEVFAVLQHIASSEADREYRYVGHVGIHDITWPKGKGVTGSIIGDLAGQGRGIGTEAKLWIQYHAFMVLNLEKLDSQVKAFNAQSLGHLLKCGYRVWGVNPKEEPHEGRRVDLVHLCCFREDWLPVWERYLETKQLPSLTDEQRRQVEEIAVRT